MSQSTPGGDPQESSSAQIRKGVGHMGGAAAVVRVVDAAASFYLLSLLTPHDMGLAALAASITIVLESVCGLGVHTSIVAAREITPDERRALLGLTTCTGFGFASVALLLAAPMAWLYDAPALEPLIMASALKILCFSLAIVPQALIAKELRFAALGTVQSLGAVVGAGGKIGLAHLGFGAWALVWANVLSGVAVLLAAWAFCWPGPPRLSFARAHVDWHLRFGSRAALSGLLTEGSKNLGHFLVGLFLGVAPLGAYRVAFDLAMIPLESIAQPIYRVTFSVFTRIGAERERLEQAFIEATRTMIGLCMPVVAVLFFAGEDLFTLVGKGTWAAAVPALRVLCWAALLRCVTRLFDNLYYARHEPHLALLDGGLTFGLLAFAMPAALLWGGDAHGILIPSHVWLWSYPPIFVALFAVALEKGALRLDAYLRGVAPALLASALTVLLTGAVALVVRSWEEPWLELLAISAAAATAYLGVTRYGKRLPQKR